MLRPLLIGANLVAVRGAKKMSKHVCGCDCGCKKIIVQCGSGAGEPQPPGAPPTRYSCVNGQCVPDPNGAYASLGACLEACRTLPPPQPVCDRVRVTFISLRVTDDGERGDGDWTLNFDVNGIFNSHVFPDDAIDDGQNLDYRIDKFVDAPIDPFTTDLTVRKRSLSYLQKKGWTLKTILGENFVFEGLGGRIDLRTSDPRPIPSLKPGKG
jgi:hypothetical protein